MSANLPPLQVGQVLIYRSVRSTKYGTDSEVTVTRIGRKWGYASSGHWREVKFDLTTGYEDAGVYSASHRVLTPEMDAEEGRRREAMSLLHEAGVRFHYGAERRFSTDTLEALARLINGGTS